LLSDVAGSLDLVAGLLHQEAGLLDLIPSQLARHSGDAFGLRREGVLRAFGFTEGERVARLAAARVAMRGGFREPAVPSWPAIVAPWPRSGRRGNVLC
jgi:hypothetical protein